MKDLAKLIKKWILADYYCKRPFLLPLHLQGRMVLEMIEAEEALRKAVTGEGDLLVAARLLGAKQVENFPPGLPGKGSAPKKASKLKKSRKKRVVRETLDDLEPPKPLKGKGFFS